MKHIFIINGIGTSGKDTFVNFCSLSRFVKNYSTIDSIKKWAEFIGYNYTKSDKDRKFLSDLKFILKNYNDFPYKETIKVIKEFNDSYYDILFIHIREIDEIKRIKEIYPEIKTILVKNDKVPIPNNDSDKQVFDYEYDYIINNNSTLEDLEKTAEKFIKSLN